MLFAFYYQDCLFDMQELFEMEPIHRFNSIFPTLELTPLMIIFDKKTRRGALSIWNRGYDFTPIYQQLCTLNFHAAIPYNPRNEGKEIGFDGNCVPTCVGEHSFRYDSSMMQTVKLWNNRGQKNYEICPLNHDSLCKKSITLI